MAQAPKDMQHRGALQASRHTLWTISQYSSSTLSHVHTALLYITVHAVMLHGPSTRRCAQQRSPSGQQAQGWARRACPPSLSLARWLAACTATFPLPKWPSRPPPPPLRCPPLPPLRCPLWTPLTLPIRSVPTTALVKVHVVSRLQTPAYTYLNVLLHAGALSQPPGLCRKSSVLTKTVYSRRSELSSKQEAVPHKSCVGSKPCTRAMSVA